MTERERKLMEEYGLLYPSDVVPVVRCKDCKFYLNSSEKCALIDTRLNFYATDKVWTEEDYCSWGERRADNG